jgi:REP element-mobilizing transposase RayT
MDEVLTHYERNLPHRLPAGATLFITYRLAGSLPREVLAQMLEEARLSPQPRKQAFARYDEWLDNDGTGPHWLAQPEVATIVKASLHFYTPTDYRLHAYCVMGNHVHLVVTLPDTLTKPFYRILQAQKRFSATRANKLLGLTGQFWARESYDHIIRSSNEYQRVIGYVLNNPVKAGLIANWRDWPHTFWEET